MSEKNNIFLREQCILICRKLLQDFCVKTFEFFLIRDLIYNLCTIQTLTARVTSRNESVIHLITHYMEKYGYKRVELKDETIGYYDLMFVQNEG